MKQRLAVNSQHTGDRSKDHRGYAEPWTSEQLDGLLSEDWLRKKVAGIRGGNEKAKDTLPYICPHYSEFKNNHRAQADIMPEAFTFMTCVDVDDLSMVDKAIKRALELNSEEGGEWQNMVLRIAYSARKKVHIYIKMPVGKTIEETQKMFCADMDVPYDESCITPERFIFVTGIDEEVYRSEHWLEAMSEKELEERREAFLNRGLDMDGRKLKSGDYGATDSAEPNIRESVDSPVDPQLQQIIDAWTKEHFSDQTKQVSRHEASLILAKDLYIMLDRDAVKTLSVLKAQPWVQDIIKERDEDVERTLRNAVDYVKAAESDAAKKGRNWKEEPSKEMQKAVAKVTGVAAKPLSKQAAMAQKLEKWGEEIEDLFPDFPMLKDVCHGLKKSQYPAALFVAGGVLMTLMTRCWYRFYHRPQQERRLNSSLYIIGHPASGKSMAEDIHDILITPIATADKPGKAALNRYKKDTKKKADNKEGQDKPEGIIRIHPARTSNGQLIEDMLNAKEIVDGKEMQLHMFTFDTELDNSITLQSGGSWINKQAMELKAFHNEKDGQMYQNQDSPVDEFNVTWNYIYTGTPIALRKKVNERNFGSGLSTRLAVIPMPKTNFKMIKFEDVAEIDWQRINRMKAWAYKLDNRCGELPLWPLVKHLYDWMETRMEDCEKDDSEADELMLKRVPYHALNYSAPFIDMRHWDKLNQAGGYWMGKYEVDETDWRLCKLIARIQYETQQHFFGVMAEHYFDDMNNDVQITGKRHQQKSVEGYSRLPEMFTKEDVMKAFLYDNGKAADKKIERLMAENYIEKIKEGQDAGKYRKVMQSLR